MHAERGAEPWRILAVEQQRPRRQSVGERAVGGEVGFALVRAATPPRRRLVAMGQRFVGAGPRDRGPHRPVERFRHGPEVLRVEQRVASGGDRGHGRRRLGFPRRRPRHDEGVRDDEPREPERLAQVTQDDG